ncbi:DsbC family protein [Vreelandella massiliensis]|uniref:DsbC family protein n=1 Tax=Vreelandella massiliensis TaxID=1816686 RepID=UPI00096AA9DE|nr:DsbC family protein [Halomonas massiliensis]MYL22221.1 thioredoxin fold domain-containing protein [Halomonas alkaliantarctica]
MRRTPFLPLALAAALSMTFAATALAQEVPKTLAQSLSVNGQAMPVEEVTATPLDGIYQVRLTSGESFYSNADGSHFVVGDLYANSEQGLINLTEQARNQERVAALESVPESERVIFRGMQAPKATVTVFTDTSCPYCSRLHETVPELNERGIAVHYLAFPRAGMQSEAARVMQQVWCADNPSEAMTAAKEGESLSGSASCDNPVASQYDLGLQVGVEGTPAIILPDGQMVPGFVPPERLAAMLGLDEQ